jgi:protein O-GlcNAc transferase
MAPDELYRLGMQSIRQSETDKAIAYFSEAARLDPANPLFYLLLGKAWHLKNDTDQAIFYCRKALSLDPDNPDLLYNLAGLLKEQGNFAEAISLYSQVTASRPDFFEGHYHLADALGESGDTLSAVKYYRKAVELNPESFASLNNLGNLMIELGDLKTAREYLEKALKLKPDSPQILNNMGFIAGELYDLELEIEYYLKALEAAPEFTEPCHNLAIAYERQGKISEARKYYQQVLKTEPDNQLYKLHSETICPVIPFNNEEIDNYRTNLENTLDHYQNRIEVDFSKLLSSNAELPHYLVYQGRNELTLRKKYAAVFKNCFPEANHTRKPGKPQIGMVVTCHHESIFCKSMKGILNGFGPEQFAITIVYNKPGMEPYFRQFLKNPAIDYLFLRDDFSAMARQIAGRNLDILYYWEVGTDTLNYFLPFCRLAPVQCTSWGWQVTTGIPQMDYYISCEPVETEEADNHYSEKLYRLKSLPYFYYRPSIPLNLKEKSYFGLPGDQRIYLCTQNLRKVHPDFDRIIAEILRRDSGSVAVFISDHKKNITDLLYRRLNHYYPDISSRVKFLPRMNETDYLNLLSLCDLSLDTIYYGGVNTTYDAFACATPVITMPTQFHRGRYTYAVYKTMGILDCVAASPEEYISLALKIAGNPELRKDISARIKERSGLIFENGAAIAELAQFFESVL